MRWIILFTSRKFVSSVLFVVGSVTMAIFGQNFGLEENIVDSIVTIAGAVSALVGYRIALKTPTEEQ
jgi:hypothetical protein